MGESFPLHCTANGKAFLAGMPPQDLARALAGRLAALTPHTITDPVALGRELDRVRDDGIAYDREEHAEGICALGIVLPGLAVAVSVPPVCPALLRAGGRAARCAARLGRPVEQALGAIETPAGRRAGQRAGRRLQSRAEP